MEHFVRVSAHSAHCATLSLISIMIFRMDLLKHFSDCTGSDGVCIDDRYCNCHSLFFGLDVFFRGGCLKITVHDIN